MGFLDVFSLLVLLFIFLLVLYLIGIVAYLPGSIARKRRSPWAEAVNTGGWIGILFPPIWMCALIAAYVRPRAGEGAEIVINQSETTELNAALHDIAERIAQLENGLRGLSPGRATGAAGGD